MAGRRFQKTVCGAPLAGGPDSKGRIVVNNTGTLKNIRVVLARPSHPGNIGAAARAMKTMGLNDLWLVSPRHFPHPDAVVRAAGADDLLDAAHVVDSVPAALAGCVLAIAATARHREMRHDVMNARSAAQAAVAAAGHPVAILFGNETAGLTADEAANCRIWARIPTAEDFSSLNLAAAVQVFVYELRMACAAVSPVPQAEFAPATIDQVEKLYAHFEERMTASGFYNPANPGRLELRLRRLLARARLEAEEVNILRGFLTTLERPKRR
jgi:tRNA/rRNA methyltransferase